MVVRAASSGISRIFQFWEHFMMSGKRTLSLIAGLLIIGPGQRVVAGLPDTPPDSSGIQQPSAAPIPLVNASFHISEYDGLPAGWAKVRFFGRDNSGIPIAPTVMQVDENGNGKTSLVARPTRYTITAVGKDGSRGWSVAAIAPGATVSLGMTLHDPDDWYAPQYWSYAIYEGYGMHLNPFDHEHRTLAGPWQSHISRLRSGPNVRKTPQSKSPAVKSAGAKMNPAVKPLGEQKKFEP
jgi:hypothetical protein